MPSVRSLPPVSGWQEKWRMQQTVCLMPLNPPCAVVKRQDKISFCFLHTKSGEWTSPFGLWIFWLYLRLFMYVCRTRWFSLIEMLGIAIFQMTIFTTSLRTYFSVRVNTRAGVLKGSGIWSAALGGPSLRSVMSPVFLFTPWMCCRTSHIVQRSQEWQ